MMASYFMRHVHISFPTGPTHGLQTIQRNNHIRLNVFIYFPPHLGHIIFSIGVPENVLTLHPHLLQRQAAQYSTGFLNLSPPTFAISTAFMSLSPFPFMFRLHPLVQLRHDLRFHPIDIPFFLPADCLGEFSQLRAGRSHLSSG